MTTETKDALVEEIVRELENLKPFRMQSFCSQPFRRDVSLSQLYVLISLHEQGPMMISEIAHLFSISMPSTSSIVDRMEERGLVARIRSGVDRRTVSVEITEHGRSVAEEFVGFKRSQVERLLDEMTQPELTQVLHGVRALKVAAVRLARRLDASEKISV